MSYKLVWIDERLFDNDKEEIKKYWKSQNKNVYFNGDECLLNLNENHNIDAQKKSLELVNEYGLETWSLIKSEVILTEEVLE